MSLLTAVRPRRARHYRHEGATDSSPLPKAEVAAVGEDTTIVERGEAIKKLAPAPEEIDWAALQIHEDNKWRKLFADTLEAHRQSIDTAFGRMFYQAASMGLSLDKTDISVDEITAVHSEIVTRRAEMDAIYWAEVETDAWAEHDAREMATGEFRILPSRRARALTEQTQETPAVVVHMRQLACNPRSSALARAHALAWWQTIEARHDDEQPALPAATSVAA